MNEIRNINVTLIDRPENPMRISFDENEIQTLVESIREHGILSPLTLREKGGRFEVIDGDSRLEAAHRLRISEVPAVVRVASDSETIVLRIIANNDRSNPDVVSEAICYARAIQSRTITIEELASKIKRSLNWIEDRLAIAEMPEYIQDALRQKLLPLGVALDLTKIDHEKTRFEWVQSAIRDGMSVAGARNALHEYEKFKYIWDNENTPEAERFVPVTPPVILWPCARCGSSDITENLHFVRVHRESCGAPHENEIA